MRPRFIPMPILITPQWPLVVTASIFQLPSKVAAVASGTEQKTANAVARVKAHRRLAIMGVLILVFCCTEWNCPGDWFPWMRSQRATSQENVTGLLPKLVPRDRQDRDGRIGRISASGRGNAASRPYRRPRSHE